MSAVDIDEYLDGDGHLVTERLLDLTAIELQELGDAMQRRHGEATAGEAVEAAALAVLEDRPREGEVPDEPA